MVLNYAELRAAAVSPWQGPSLVISTTAARTIPLGQPWTCSEGLEMRVLAKNLPFIAQQFGNREQTWRIISNLTILPCHMVHVCVLWYHDNTHCVFGTV